jgi:hypothetical protein
VIPKRRLLAATILAALTLGPTAVAMAGDDDAPGARTDAATVVTDTTAQLNGTVWTEGMTLVMFEYGTTTDYRLRSGASEFGDDRTVSVFDGLTGLTPGTVYHYRVRAWNARGTSYGTDRTFTITGTATAPGGPAATPAGLAHVAPGAPETAPQPQIGDSVVVAPSAGTVLIKSAGGTGFVELAAGDAIPVGSIVDARHGTVKLTSALGGGATQTGEFRGALFQVRQAADAHGMTDIVLRGGELNRCAGTSARAAAAGSKPPVRRLWSSDSGGRFRTHGRNSVATVRGTKWVTTETCAGTRTTVTAGAVSVRDVRRKTTVLVSSGHSYLARSTR